MKALWKEGCIAIALVASGCGEPTLRETLAEASIGRDGYRVDSIESTIAYLSVQSGVPMELDPAVYDPASSFPKTVLPPERTCLDCLDQVARVYDVRYEIKEEEGKVVFYPQNGVTVELHDVHDLHPREDLPGWLVQNVAPGSWGGNCGIQLTPNDQLLVYNRPAVHQALREVLQTLRETFASRPPPVSPLVDR